MEFAAWFLHKYVMHGFLWNLHEDHHVQGKNFFQKNDLFFLVFAIPSASFISLGLLFKVNFLPAIGFGILLYGIAYFLVHEVLIHKRFPKIRKLIFRNIKNNYLESLQLAHRMHHKHTGKDNGESFGMLIIEKKYFKSKIES